MLTGDICLHSASELISDVDASYTFVTFIKIVVVKTRVEKTDNPQNMYLNPLWQEYSF